VRPQHRQFARQLGSMMTQGSGVFQDLSGHERRIEGRLLPRAASDVVRIVRSAQQFGVCLHAVSCGRNWGFGSSLPAVDNAWLVDLHLMTKIRSYDDESGTVLLEPGVTQGQLSDRLIKEGNRWLFNVTGAGDSTSVVGNALERGIGYFGQRHLDLIDLEIVTGTGEVVSTCLGNQKLQSFPAPLGCDATGLFLQSALGIVTQARLRLIRRAEGNGVVMARLKSSKHTALFFDRIIELKRDDVISGVPHVANHPRLTTTMLPWLKAPDRARFLSSAPVWTAALPILGNRDLAAARHKTIKRALNKISRLEIFSGGKVEFKPNEPSPLEQFKQLASGYPSNLALPGVQWCALKRADLTCLDPEKTKAGLIHITPAVATSRREIQRALSVVQNAAKSLALEPLPITVNVVNSRFSVLVISLPFKRPDLSVHQKAAILQTALRSAGFRPYRLGLDFDSQSSGFSRGSYDLLQRLKDALDPQRVFATSKYELGALKGTSHLQNHCPEWDDDSIGSLLEAA